MSHAVVPEPRVRCSPLKYDTRGMKVLLGAPKDREADLYDFRRKKELSRAVARRAGDHPRGLALLTSPTPAESKDPQFEKYELGESDLVLPFIPANERPLDLLPKLVWALRSVHVAGFVHLDVSIGNVGRTVAPKDDDAASFADSDSDERASNGRHDGDERKEPANPPREWRDDLSEGGLPKAEGPVTFFDLGLMSAICRDPFCDGCERGRQGTIPFMSLVQHDDFFCPSPYNDLESAAYLAMYIHRSKQGRPWLKSEDLDMDSALRLKREWLRSEDGDEVERKIRRFARLVQRKAILWMSDRHTVTKEIVHELLETLGPPSVLQVKLRKAVEANDIERCNALLISGADPNAQDEEGRTALHYAAIGRFDRIYHFLRHRGADDTIKDKNGKTSEMIVRMKLSHHVNDLRKAVREMYEIRSPPTPGRKLELIQHIAALNRALR